jgi:ribosomal protein S18 acetylase RimI-like enzyme
MSAPTIRRATSEDADTLSRIGAQTFTETFGHLYPVEDLAAFLVYAYGIERTRADLADPAKASWLVERDGKTIGYASAGPAGLPHDDLKPTDGELYRLYILAAHQGGGVGRRLLDTVLAWLERDGPRTLWIGVWSLNHGAQRLYRRLGFEKVGDYIFPVGQTRDEEFILRRG